MTSSRLTIAPHRSADPPPQRKEKMTAEELSDEQYVIDCCEECLMDIETLESGMWLSALTEYAENNNLRIAVAGLEELMAAKVVLIDRGPDLLHALIKEAKQRHTP